jgi:O-antigen/teichoic acid export membrane protein
VAIELENPVSIERSVRLTIVKNAVANVARGAASALVALAVPPFLTRALSPEKYGAWVLVLQLAAYVGYLEFGIQTAVGRFVAHGNERSDFEHRNRIVNTSFALLTGAGLLAMMLIASLIAILPRFFREMPVGLYPAVRTALALVGGSLAFGLPASVFNGIFVGIQRYDILAAIVAGPRIFSAVLVVVIARHGGGIPAMALCMAAVNLASYALQWFMYRRYAPDIRLSPQLVSRDAARELAGYCASLTIWSFGMLLVSGLDLLLVGAFDFEKVAFYAVAASLVTFVAGLQNAVFGAMMPSTAVLHARGDSWALGRMVIDGTRYGMFLLLLTGVPLLLAGKPILRIWVGPVYAVRATVFLQILVVANILRLSATPFVVALIGTGQQRLIVLTPILEAVANLSISVLAGYYWGAVGIAFGTLCGAFVGVGGHILYNMPRATEIRFNIREYGLESLVKPVLCAVPIGLVLLLQSQMGDLQLSVRMVVMLVGGTATLWCFWRWGLVSTQRQRILAVTGLRGADR